MGTTAVSRKVEKAPGELIARVCERRGWSKRELARRVGVDPKALRAWEASGLPAGRREQLEQVLADAPDPIDVLAVRRGLGWTQQELAARLGVHWTTVARWEAGARVPARCEDQLRDLSAELPSPVRAARRRLGLTQIELARRVEVSPALISHWERGAARIPVEQQRRLAALAAAASTELTPEWLGQRRAELGLSIRELAKRLECTPSRLSDWERGRRPVPAAMESALRRELGGSKARTASRDAEVLELARRKPGLSVPQLLEQFPAHDAGAVQGSLQRHLGAGCLFRARGRARDRTGRPRLVWRIYPEPQPSEPVLEITGSRLRAARKRRKWTQEALAAALGVSREAVREWEQRGNRPIPPARARQVYAVLHDQDAPAPRRRRREATALPDLRRRRQAAGLTQAELAERLRLRRGQAAVSAWERGAKAITAPTAERVLEALAAAAAERVTREELRLGRERAGWTLGQLAARLGVARARVGRWELGRSEIPSRFWAVIRAELEAAPAVVRGEAMVDLRERRQGLLWSQRELARRLGIWQADVSRWERGAPVPPPVRERLERELDAGVPAAEADPARARRAAVAALVAEEPGLSPKAVLRRLGGKWADVRSAINALAEAGELHQRPSRYVDRGGRTRFRPGLYPGPAAASLASPDLAGPEIVRSRQDVGWSQAELARRLGISQAIVNRWELGKVVPAPAYVAELERVLAAGAAEIDPRARQRLA